MREAQKRLRVLISAYACEPNKGSEPGVGWNVAKGMATHHDIWVLTRANNRRVIEAELAREPVEGLHFLYYDLPHWASWWKRGGRGVQLYYYLWQIGALRVARRAHLELTFDMGHHVTFVKYWAPSFFTFLGIPFLWGPVGGGETAPKPFWKDFTRQGQRYEHRREIARWLAEHDPLVRRTAQRCCLGLATTRETYARVLALGVSHCEVLSQVAVQQEELTFVSMDPRANEKVSMRFISIGNLLHLKGFHMGLRAFAKAELSDAEYWVVGDGPERFELERLVARLGIQRQVRFLGQISRADAMRLLQQASALVHPSLHDSGGFVCLEAMASGKPVICLNIGGPAELVDDRCGILIPAFTPEQVVGDISANMRRLAEDSKMLREFGMEGRRRADLFFRWETKCMQFDKYYRIVHERLRDLKAHK